MSVILETTKGDLTVDLYIKERPKTCLNFMKLCKLKYYNFCSFHHVERNFLCQTGDPTGTGKGGDSVYGMLYGDQARYYEAEQVPILKHTKAGLLSMVNVGDNMLGSQFFITLRDNIDYLDDGHCVFGEVVEGQEALLSINDAICDENHIPYQDIRISHTVILDDPFNDPANLQVPSSSPERPTDMTDNNRIAADEDINDLEGKTHEEVDEIIADKEAKSRATILEMIGDLPDADAAPPENVLFVCKLNPVTTDEDLEIIFSRFGTIVNCEIIRDRLNGNSLQYAFIEFDNPQSCENAYFKMGNVLIDDRRIHVDFSQSVSRLRYKGKGRAVEVVGSGAYDPNTDSHRKSNASKESYSNRPRRYDDHDRPVHRENRDRRHDGSDRNRRFDPPSHRSQPSRGRSDHEDRRRSIDQSKRRDYHTEDRHRYDDRHSSSHRREDRSSSRRYDDPHQHHRGDSVKVPHRRPEVPHREIKNKSTATVSDSSESSSDSDSKKKTKKSKKSKKNKKSKKSRKSKDSSSD